MNKYEQLIELIKMGLLLNDGHSNTFAGTMATIWGWRTNQAAINESEDDVSKMASDYIKHCYQGAAKPEWLNHLGDIGGK